MNTTKYTVHGVLAGAYRGRDIGERALLTHASLNGADAVCRRIKEGSLCDEVVDDAITCPVCAKWAAKVGRERVHTHEERDAR